MGLAESQRSITRPATADLTGAQGKLVTLAGALATKGAICFPLVNDNAAPTKEPCALAISGKANVIYGATVAQYAALAANASGLAVTATTGDHIIGYALVAGAVNEWGEMLVLKDGKA
ncbi:MAG TPA: hypothetical protein VGD74_02300 [Vulgatibacter sp.]